MNYVLKNLISKNSTTWLAKIILCYHFKAMILSNDFLLMNNNLWSNILKVRPTEVALSLKKQFFIILNYFHFIPFS